MTAAVAQGRETGPGTASGQVVSTLVIDAGQTGIKARLELAGAVPGEAPALNGRLFSAPGIRTDLPLVPQLAAVVADIAATLDRPVDAVAAGVSGLTAAETQPRALLSLTESLGVRSVSLAHDSVTAYLGTLGDERGVVVAAGTGVVTLAVGRERVARVDGWGYLIGDAGSGYWIGRAALDAVMRAHDGRGPATALTERVRVVFPALEDAYIELQRDPGKVGRIAAFGKDVAELAGTDAVAASISDGAAAELAAAAVAGLRRVGEDGRDDPVICSVGGVFRNERVGATFNELLTQRFPAVRTRPAVVDALLGVSRLNRLSTESALRTLVAHADAGPFA